MEAIMYPYRNSMLEYKVSEENQPTYQKLCKELAKSPSVFQYNPPVCGSSASSDNLKRSRADVVETRKITSKKKSEASNENSNASKMAHEVSVSSDIKALQKQLIGSLANMNSIDTNLLKAIEPSRVCASDASVISDDILIQVCKKSEKANDNVASIIGSLLLLPKIYHLTSKLSPPSCDALGNFIRCHPKNAVSHMLVPFLQLCPVMQDQHRDMVLQMTDHCEASSLPHLLRALSSRDAVNEVDLDIFKLLCTKVDPKEDGTHSAVLAFMRKSQGSHHALMKYGQCLLFIVKHMGPHIKDEETLQSLVDSHTSGMKKAVQIQLKAVLRNKQ